MEKLEERLVCTISNNERCGVCPKCLAYLFVVSLEKESKKILCRHCDNEREKCIKKCRDQGILVDSIDDIYKLDNSSLQLGVYKTRLRVSYLDYKFECPSHGKHHLPTITVECEGIVSRT